MQKSLMQFTKGFAVTTTEHANNLVWLRATFLLMIFINLFTQAQSLCPKSCTCVHAITHVTVNCNHRGLTSLPDLTMFEKENLPLDLFLNGNRISQLIGTSLWFVRKRLRVLEIYQNAKSLEISPKAFVQSRDVLKVLKLSPLSINLQEDMVLFAVAKNLEELQFETRSTSGGGYLNGPLNGRRGDSSMKVLHIRKSSISSISNTALEGLKLSELGLSQNYITAFPTVLTNMMSDTLRILYLDGNKISSLEQHQFPSSCKLQTLHLQENRITTIERGTFDKCSQLRNLNIAGNELLVSLDPAIFASLHSLTLDISNTGITNLDFIKADQIEELRAFYIPCECQNNVKYCRTFRCKLKGSCRQPHTGVSVDIKRLNLDCIGSCSGAKKEEPNSLDVLWRVFQEASTHTRVHAVYPGASQEDSEIATSGTPSAPNADTISVEEVERDIKPIHINQDDSPQAPNPLVTPTAIHGPATEEISSEVGVIRQDTTEVTSQSGQQVPENTDVIVEKEKAEVLSKASETTMSDQTKNDIIKNSEISASSSIDLPGVSTETKDNKEDIPMKRTQSSEKQDESSSSREGNLSPADGFFTESSSIGLPVVSTETKDNKEDTPIKRTQSSEKQDESSSSRKGDLSPADDYFTEKFKVLNSKSTGSTPNHDEVEADHYDSKKYQQTHCKNEEKTHAGKSSVINTCQQTCEQTCLQQYPNSIVARHIMSPHLKSINEPGQPLSSESVPLSNPASENVEKIPRHKKEEARPDDKKTKAAPVEKQALPIKSAREAASDVEDLKQKQKEHVNVRNKTLKSNKLVPHPSAGKKGQRKKKKARDKKERPKKTSNVINWLFCACVVQLFLSFAVLNSFSYRENCPLPSNNYNIRDTKKSTPHQINS